MDTAKIADVEMSERLLKTCQVLEATRNTFTESEFAKFSRISSPDASAEEKLRIFHRLRTSISIYIPITIVSDVDKSRVVRTLPPFATEVPTLDDIAGHGAGELASRILNSNTSTLGQVEQNKLFQDMIRIDYGKQSGTVTSEKSERDSLNECL